MIHSSLSIYVDELDSGGFGLLLSYLRQKLFPSLSYCHEGIPQILLYCHLFRVYSLHPLSLAA